MCQSILWVQMRLPIPLIKCTDHHLRTRTPNGFLAVIFVLSRAINSVSIASLIDFVLLFPMLSSEFWEH